MPNQSNAPKVAKAFKLGCLILFGLMLLGFIGILLWSQIKSERSQIEHERGYEALRRSGPENVVKGFLQSKNHNNKIELYFIDPEIRNTKKSSDLERFGEIEAGNIKEGFISLNDPQAKYRDFPGVKLPPSEYATADNLTNIQVEKINIRQMNQNNAIVEVGGTFYPTKSSKIKSYNFGIKRYSARFSLVCHLGQWYVHDLQWSTIK